MYSSEAAARSQRLKQKQLRKATRRDKPKRPKDKEAFPNLPGYQHEMSEKSAASYPCLCPYPCLLQ